MTDSEYAIIVDRCTVDFLLRTLDLLDKSSHISEDELNGVRTEIIQWHKRLIKLSITDKDEDNTDDYAQ